jgi:hypothetical protein
MSSVWDQDDVTAHNYHSDICEYKNDKGYGNITEGRTHYNILTEGKIWHEHSRRCSRRGFNMDLMLETLHRRNVYQWTVSTSQKHSQMFRNASSRTKEMPPTPKNTPILVSGSRTMTMAV